MWAGKTKGGSEMGGRVETREKTIIHRRRWPKPWRPATVEIIEPPRRNLKPLLWILAVAVAVVITINLAGCAGTGKMAPDLSSTAYQAASPETQDKISRGVITRGMNIDECRAAWPGQYFIFVSGEQRGESRFETWKVETYSEETRRMIWLFLTTQEGRIVDISDSDIYTQKRPQDQPFPYPPLPPLE
jgi:hypothetical protein